MEREQIKGMDEKHSGMGVASFIFALCLCAGGFSHRKSDTDLPS
jgi:hypothetical protein